MMYLSMLFTHLLCLFENRVFYRRSVRNSKITYNVSTAISVACRVEKCTSLFWAVTTNKISSLKLEEIPMGRRQGMTLEERQRAVGMLHAGMTARAVARHFNRHESTISRLRNRLRETGRVNDRPRSGRPRKTTPREDRHITTLSRRNRLCRVGR